MLYCIDIIDCNYNCSGPTQMYIDYNGLQVSDFTYDAGMRESNHTLGVTGLTRVKEYNRDDNLMTRSYITGKPELSYNYAYDQNKNVTDDNIEGLITDYSWGSVVYDDENRLTSWNNLNTQSRSWALDYVGNFESRTVDGVLEPRTHSDVHETTAVAGENLLYDPKGNLTNDQDGQILIWDIDNHMSSSTNGSVMTTYEYDAIGRRVSKSTSGLEAVYVCSGQQVISEYDGAGVHERSYVYGSYVDKPVVMIDIASGDQTYYHCNRQYSVTGLTGEQGNVIELYAYTPYGERTVFDSAGNEKAGSDSDNPYGFTGRRLDKETGLWYFRARYYDDELGRFISRDPLGYVDGMNLYRGYFVPNGVDPSGLKWTIDGDGNFDTSAPPATWYHQDDPIVKCKPGTWLDLPVTDTTIKCQCIKKCIYIEDPRSTELCDCGVWNGTIHSWTGRRCKPNGRWGPVIEIHRQCVCK